MEILALFFLGIIQGLTEFLPVSSSGHLVLFSKIFNMQESLFVSIVLHVATLLSIVVVFHKQIWEILKHPFSKKMMLYVVATIPTCLIVLILMPMIKLSFGGEALSICFLISAIFLYVSESLSKRKIATEIDYRDAMIIGIAQGFAVFPGISRSGSTISAGLLCGKDKKQTAEFCFLLSIPIILLSLLMEVYEICAQKVVINISVIGIILACVSAFIVGIFAIKTMIKLTQKSNLKWFAIYLLCIAMISLFIL